jgi:hypothetical protein
MLRIDRNPKPLGRESAIFWPFDIGADVAARIEHFADNQTTQQKPCGDAKDNRQSSDDSESGQPWHDEFLLLRHSNVVVIEV